MSTPQNIQAVPGKPWEERERNGCVASLLALAFILLIFAGLAALIITIAGFTSSEFNLGMVIGGIVGLGVSVVLMILIYPQLKVPARYKPRFLVPPNTLGQPFDVRFQPKQRLNPIGMVQFTLYGVHIEGMQEASTGAIFLFGWLLASAFRKKFTRDIPYQYITSVQIEGQKATLLTPTEEPNLFIFRVSFMDGERFYRELYAHYPNTVVQWAHLFVGAPVSTPQPPAPPQVPASN